MKIFYITATAFLLVSCEHKISPKVQETVSAITKRSTINGYPELLNFDPNYKYLKAKASEQDLLYLANHENNDAMVKVMAFKVLSDNGYPEIRSLFYKHLHDKQIVTTRRGCVINSEGANSYMLEILHPEWKAPHKFSRKEYDSLYKIIHK